MKIPAFILGVVFLVSGLSAGVGDPAYWPCLIISHVWGATYSILSALDRRAA